MTKIAEQEFQMVTRRGQQAFGLLHVESSDARRIRGELYSDHFRIVPELDSFAGTRLRLRFGVDVTGLEAGEKVEGNLIVVLEDGERKIPVCVLVEEAFVETSYGPIRTLSDFTVYAENEPDNAFRLFRSGRFEDLIPEEERGMHALWRGLSSPPQSIEAMEEFLTGAGLKEAVSLTYGTPEISFFQLRDSVEEILTIRRSTWGSISIYASADSDFIELPRTVLTDRDFVGSVCDFEYRIRADRLGQGVRRGFIRLRSLAGSCEIPMKASLNAEGVKVPKLESDRAFASLTRERIDYMLERTDRGTYAGNSLSLIEELFTLTREHLTGLRLYQAYLEQLRGERDKAASILREFGEDAFSKEEIEEKAAYLYLAGLTGTSRDSSAAIAERIRSAYIRAGSDYTMMKLVFLTSPDIGHYPRRKKKYEEELFARGVRSPLLYAEALRDYRENDALLTDLDEFSLQVLVFGTKQGLLTEALALRASYLSDRIREFSPLLLRVLTAAYENWPKDGILEAIVRVLMKGEQSSARCFPWYELAVEKNLRVLRLYEYYVETMPETKRTVLPLPVRKYFMYNSTLSEPLTAKIYANISRNRREDRATYDSYREKMEQFAVDSLYAGRRGDDYAALYQEFIKELPDAEAEDVYADCAFTEKLYIDEPSVRQVIVIHDELSGEASYPVVRGRASIRRYTKDAKILFEDASRMRYAGSVSARILPVMDTQAAMKLLRSPRGSHTGLLLTRALRLKETAEQSTSAGKRAKEAADIYRRVASSNAFSDPFRDEARKELLSLIAEGRLDGPEAHIPEEEIDNCSRADKGALLKALLSEGRFEEGYRILRTEGTEHVKPDMLVLFVSRFIREQGDARDDELTALTAQIFREGLYDEQMLNWLASYFRGGMEEMLAVRTAAAEFLVDTRQIDDRILSRAVFTHNEIAEGPDILRDYAAEGGRWSLVRTYLAFYADTVLGSEDMVHPAAAEGIREMLESGEMCDFAMKLSLLKYYSEKAELTVHEEVIVDELLSECGKRGIHLSFMKNLPQSFVSAYRLEDKVYVEVKAEEGDEVRIRYSFGEEWKTETLLPKFRGLCVKEFTLFYGEALTYQLLVTHDGTTSEGETVTKSGSGADLTGNSAFQRINRMLKAQSEGDGETLRTEMREYLRAKHISEVLFQVEAVK